MENNWLIRYNVTLVKEVKKSGFINAISLGEAAQFLEEYYAEDLIEITLLRYITDFTVMEVTNDTTANYIEEILNA